MHQVQEGQCGLCAFFGEHNNADRRKIEQIQANHQAPEDLVEDCEHPQHAGLHLKVTPISGCDGYKPAPLLVS
jgi:hypothetical protein